MTDINKQFNKFAVVVEEDTAGTYKAPTNADFIKLSSEGANSSETKGEVRAEFLDGSPLTKNLKLSRISDVSFSVNCYAQGAKVLGEAPAYTKFHEAYGMSKTALTTRIVSDDDIHTTTTIKIANTTGLRVGQVVLIKESEKSTNPDHISPIASIIANTSITLLIPAAVAFSAEVEIEKQVELVEDKTVKKTLSLTHVYDGNEQECRVAGGIPNSIALSNNANDTFPTWTIAGEARSRKEVLNASSFAPDYSDGDLLLPDYVWIDGVKTCVTEFSVEMTKNLNKRKCLGAKEISDLREVDKRTTQGTLAIMKDQEVLAIGLDGQKRSIFYFIAEYADVEQKTVQSFVSVYIPEAIIKTAENGENEGFLTTSHSFESIPSDDTKGTRISIG
jgi:hypothetical protein